MAYIRVFSTPAPPPGVLSNILFSASFICLLRSPQLGTLRKDRSRLLIGSCERSLWSAANFVNNQIYDFLLLFKLWWHYQNTYIKWSICYIINFEGPRFCQLSTFRFFLILPALKTLAIYVLSENLILPTPPPHPRIKFTRFGSSSRWNALSQKKNLATGLAEDNSLE